jgi:hypothetical protein
VLLAELFDVTEEELTELVELSEDDVVLREELVELVLTEEALTPEETELPVEFWELWELFELLLEAAAALHLAFRSFSCALYLACRSWRKSTNAFTSARVFSG